VYDGFAPSLRDAEELRAERGQIVCYESIRSWRQRFGAMIAAGIQRDPLAPVDKWHMDAVALSIRARSTDFNGPLTQMVMFRKS